jgi:hypothetical protein
MCKTVAQLPFVPLLQPPTSLKPAALQRAAATRRALFRQNDEFQTDLPAGVIVTLAGTN